MAVTTPYDRQTYPLFASAPPSQLLTVPAIGAGQGEPLPQVSPISAGVGNRPTRNSVAVNVQSPVFQAYQHN